MPPSFLWCAMGEALRVLVIVACAALAAAVCFVGVP